MTYKENLEQQEKEKAFLDTIDIQGLVEETDNDDIYEIMDMIELKYKDQYLDEDFIFEHMDASDFSDYLQQRYPTANIYEHVETTYHVLF